MTRKTRSILIAVVVIILLINIPPIKYIFSLAEDGKYFRYNNNSGSFTFTEFKARDYEMMERRLQNFMKKGNSETTVYRLFGKSVWRVWRWGDYFFDDRYKLPYMSWEKISRSRGELELKTGSQDF